MFIEKVKTPGLAHLSWIIGDKAAAVVVDPRRDIDVYLAMAQKHNVNITTILETHRNEDLISGSKILGDYTGATVYHGPDSDTPIEYAQTINDGSMLDFSEFQIKAVHTPGHTNDSMSYALFDKEQGGPAVLVFTGDALFVGDVGRTDFYPDEHESAGKLFESLKKILALGDQAILCPAHGAGSVCGSGMASREFSTLGHERSANPMLQLTKKQDFVERKTAESHYKPPYFSMMEAVNGKGPSAISSLDNLKILNVSEMKRFQSAGVRIIDTRDTESFAAAHIPGAINLPVDLVTAYAGWVLSPDDDITVVAQNLADAKTACLHLSRIGFDNVNGAFIQAMSAWAASGEGFSTIKMTPVNEISERLNQPPHQWQLLDVRKHEEVEENKIRSAKHVYLGHLPLEIPSLDKSARFTVLCASGVRATVGASLLKNAGIDEVDVFLGSMGAWQRHR